MTVGCFVGASRINDPPSGGRAFLASTRLSDCDPNSGLLVAVAYPGADTSRVRLLWPPNLRPGLRCIQFKAWRGTEVWRN